jgi:hypothetical protein
LPSEKIRGQVLEVYEYAKEHDLLYALYKLGISTKDLWKAFDEKKLRSAMREPDKESDLRKPVKDHVSKKLRYSRAASEVPLPSRSRRRATVMDVAAYKKKALGIVTGKYSVIGIELKIEATKAAIRQAFAQAEEYRRFCEYGVVCFSPLLYLRYLDEIQGRIEQKEFPEVGVWISDKRRVLAELREATGSGVADTEQQPIVNFIDKHEY